MVLNIILYVHVHVCYTCTCTCMCVQVHVWTCTCIFWYLHVHVHVFFFLLMYKYMFCMNCTCIIHVCTCTCTWQLTMWHHWHVYDIPFIRGVYISRWRVSILLYLLIKYFMVAGSKFMEQWLWISAISTISVTSCLHSSLPFPIFYPVSYLFSSSCYDKLYILYTCTCMYT